MYLFGVSRTDQLFFDLAYHVASDHFLGLINGAGKGMSIARTVSLNHVAADAQQRSAAHLAVIHGFFDPAAGTCARAERAFVRALGGGCSAPMGAYGELRGDTLVLTGMFCREDGGDFWRASVQGPAREAEELGKTLAQTWRDAHGG